MSLYPEVTKRLLESCRLYRSGEITLNQYKSAIWSAVEQIVAIEEKELREFLKKAEAELDSIQFTTDDDKVFDATLPVVKRIEERVSREIEPE